MFSQSIDDVMISSDGRIKPLQTFFKESIRILYGKETTNIASVKRSATKTVIYLYDESSDCKTEALFRLDHLALKQHVGLNEAETFFNYHTLSSNETLKETITEAVRKSRNEEKITEVEDAALQINQQLNVFSRLMNVLSYEIIPKNQSFISVYDGLIEGIELEFKSGFVPLILDVAEVQSVELSEELLSKRNYELQYNALNLFLWTWVLMCVSTLFMCIYQITPRKTIYRLAGITFAISLSLLIYGFILRVLISGRAPVTNMYESVLWVGFTAAAIAAFQFLSKKENTKKRIPYSLVAGTLSIMAADLLPTVFDSSISPLQPVLRSNFWLTTHVLIITFSYGAFGVSFIISLVSVLRYVFQNQRYSVVTERANYSTLKIGTLTLALGTLTGALWADYAWGRFWGWDPKETWAAITLVLYMIILHGRFAGWVKKELNFIYSIFGFISVLMAWYGVNYILGVGLHSYGFSKSGNSWFFYLALALTVLNMFAIKKFNKENKQAHLKTAYTS